MKKLTHKLTLFLAFTSLGALASEEAPKKRMRLQQNLHTREVTGRTSDELIRFSLIKDVKGKNKDQLTKMLFDHMVSDRTLGDFETKFLIETGIEAGANIDDQLQAWKWERQKRLRTPFYEGTFLQCATTFGQLKAMKALIDVGANLEQSSGGYPCALLCSIKHLPAAKLLLKEGADTRCTTTDKDTVLHFAAHHGSVEAMELFLEHDPGLDVSAKNYHGETPLHVAAECGHGDAVKFLLARGANVNDEYEHSEFGKVTPLNLAANNPNPSRETLNALILCERIELNNEELYDDELIEQLHKPECLSLLSLEAMQKYENIAFPRIVRKMVDMLESGDLPPGYQ